MGAINEVNLRKFVLFILLVVSAQMSFGQQDALYSQYMFNPFAINPAYAGSRNSISAVILHRSQWLGLNGAPNTQTVAIHSKIDRVSTRGKFGT